jgi:hypothetical protein
MHDTLLRGPSLPQPVLDYAFQTPTKPRTLRLTILAELLLPQPTSEATTYLAHNLDVYSSQVAGFAYQQLVGYTCAGLFCWAQPLCSVMLGTGWADIEPES